MLARTQKVIDGLHPSIRGLVTLGVNQCDTALRGRARILLVQGIRTFPEQDALFKKRPKVTNAKAGQSYHNYGLAFDYCLQVDGKDISWNTAKDWDGDHIADWMEVATIFVALGFKWGRAFNDLPHMEKTFGLNWRDMLLRYNKKDFIPGTNFIRL